LCGFDCVFVCVSLDWSLIVCLCVFH